MKLCRQTSEILRFYGESHENFQTLTKEQTNNFKHT